MNQPSLTRRSVLWATLPLAISLPLSLPSDAAAQQEAFELDTLTVTSATASGYEVNAQDAPASISVISAEDLQGKSFRDVSEALREVPGVFVEDGPTGKGGSQEVSIRGFSSQYTLILVDGVPQNSQQAYYNGNGSGAEYGWLPPIADIERIEVIRGPMSTLHGSDALGGVINIITRRSSDRWSGTITMDSVLQQDRDSGDRQQSQFRISGPLSDSLSLTLNGSTLDRAEDQITDGYREFERRDIAVELGWQISEKQSLSLETDHGTQRTRGTEVATGSDSLVTPQHQKQTLHHRLSWSDDIRTSSYLQRSQLKQDDGNYRSTYERVTADTRTVFDLENHRLSAGLQLRDQLSENPDRGLGLQDLDRRDMALYAEDEWFIGDSVSLTTGVRWVNDENYGDKIVPRLYGVYFATDALTIKGGISGGYITPDLKQGDSNWIEGGGGPSCPDCRDIGNTDLQPEESVSIELSAQWQGNSGLAVSATAFLTEFSERIIKPVICDTREGDASCVHLGEQYTALYQYTNVDEAEIKGVELALDTPIGKDWSLTASYTLTDSEQKSGSSEGMPLDTQPRHRATFALDHDFNERTRWWSQVRYRGKAQQVVGRGGLSEAYPGYTLADTGVTLELNENLRLYGSILNVFDKEIDNDTYGRYADGRRLNAGLTIEFR